MYKAVLFFLAGVFGATATDVFVLIFGTLPVQDVIGVEFAPDLDLISLLMDLAFGGLWGLLFFLPFLNDSPIIKGAIISLFPFAFHMLMKDYLFGNLNIAKSDYYVPVIALIFAFDIFWGLMSGTFLAFIDGAKKT